MKILLDNGHGQETVGKSSPDGRLLEYAYAREIAGRLQSALLENGYDCECITPELEDISLRERCKRVNRICREEGAQNCLLISIHCNASGADGNWHKPNGYCVFVSPNASEKSKRLAQAIYAEAEKYNLQGNRCVPPEKYWVKSLAMCRDTNCPAVLTENLFQDNKDDVDYLLSEEGKQAIVDIHYNGIVEYINGLK